MALLRQIIPIASGVAIALGFKEATVSATVNLLLQVGGPLFALVGIVWAYVANSKSSIITSAANMPEVKSVELKATAPANLVDSTPPNVTKA